MKKIIALACTLVMLVSMFAVSANAATDGCTATLEFAGYETKGTATFAKIVVKATIPDTLVPYEVIPADWETTFEDSYKGLMFQGCQFIIPNVTGLTYVGSLSSAASYVQIQDNKAAGNVTVFAANTGSYDTYYAGAIDEVATLYYRITGDVTAEYNVALSSVKIGLVSVDEVTGAVTPKEYADFAITNAVVKEEAPAFEPKTETLPAVESSASELEVAKVTVPSLTDTYTNIGIYTATIPAAAKSEAGFIWVNDKSDVTDNKYTFDASALNGGGEFTYTVLLYGIPADTTITAIPYYVTAAE